MGIHQALLLGNGNFGIVSIEDQSITDTETDPDIAAATLSFTSAGAYNGGSWLSGGNASNYEIRATKTAGVNPSGSALNTWLNLGTDRSWVVSQIGVGFKTSVLTIQIRETSGFTVLDSASMTIRAEVSA